MNNLFLPKKLSGTSPTEEEKMKGESLHGIGTVARQKGVAPNDDQMCGTLSSQAGHKRCYFTYIELC